MKWNQTVKEEIINEAKETAKACLIAGFSHSYGTAEEFENDNSKMIVKKNAFLIMIGFLSGNSPINNSRLRQALHLMCSLVNNLLRFRIGQLRTNKEIV